MSQRFRERVEEVFGWLKTVGLLRHTRHRGRERVGGMFTFAGAVYNLVRLGTLRAVPRSAVAVGGTPTTRPGASNFRRYLRTVHVVTRGDLAVHGPFFRSLLRGGDQPGGLVSGQSGPIPPSGEQITFTNVCTESGSYPDTMTPSFGPNVTINVFRNGNLV